MVTSGKEKMMHTQPTKQSSLTNKRAGVSSSSSSHAAMADLEGVASSRPLQVCLHVLLHHSVPLINSECEFGRQSRIYSMNI